MSATNHTTNYELPIFVGSDKPAWLVDWNGAMTAIDTALHQVEGKADQAGTDIGGIESSISTINGTLTAINNAVSQLRIDTNANTGSINTITSLIGNGEPTTTDKTIIGAINEIYAIIGSGSDLEASTVVYDNTDSGLDADDVQSAIDELCVYSSTERKVGKWTDGNDLYEIALSITVASDNLNSWKDYSTGITGSELISCDFSVQHPSNGTVYFSTGSTSTASLRHMMNILNGNFSIYAGANDYIGGTAHAILRYTKSA